MEIGRNRGDRVRMIKDRGGGQRKREEIKIEQREMFCDAGG